MARENYVTGLDVGSSSVRVVVAQPSTNPEAPAPTILGAVTAPMEGMQKGAVTDVDAAAQALTTALNKVETIAGVAVEHAYVSISAAHISSQTSKGVIAVSRADGEITDDDVARVINASQAVSLPNNREIIHVLPQRYTVDGQTSILDPVGMTGVRLEAETHIIDGSAPFIKNIAKAINQAGVHIEDFVFAPLAASKSVLDKRQRDLGVVLLDLGAGTTSMAVYEDDTLMHTGVLPLGSSHITNDIAIGLRTGIDVAEAIKCEHGTALIDQALANERIVVGEDGDDDQVDVSRKEVAEIISARLDEMFAFVQKELVKINRAGLLPAGVVFTGGGSILPGVVEIAKEKLRLPAKVGVLPELNGLADETQGSDYATVIGLVLWAMDNSSHPGRSLTRSLPDVGKTVQSVRGWFKTFMP